MSIRITFPDDLSEQLDQVNGEGSSFIEPIDYEGRVRVSYFKHTNTPVVSNADVVALCQIPKGARILKGNIQWLAHGTSAAGTLSFVDQDGSALKTLSSALDISSDGESDFADTINTFSGYVATEAGYVVVTAGADWPTDGAKLQGHIEYVVD